MLNPFAVSHIQPAQLYTFTASIKNTSLYTQHLHYHTAELLEEHLHVCMDVHRIQAIAGSLFNSSCSAAWKRSRHLAASPDPIVVIHVTAEVRNVSCPPIRPSFTVTASGLCNFPRPLRFLLMSIPLNVIVIHLQTHGRK